MHRITSPLVLLLTASAVAAPPRYKGPDALQSEWKRVPPSQAALSGLSAGDRARLELSLARIGAPGAPSLLGPEWEKPTEEAWLARAKAARTPLQRFEALFALNRLKSPRALAALEGLKPQDAATWPATLHLEAALASAQLNGAEMDSSLAAFLMALSSAGKTDPVRAQAARIRLVTAGKAARLLAPVPATPGSLLALMDAWNRTPWKDREPLVRAALQDLGPASPLWKALGVQAPTPAVLATARTGLFTRLTEGLPDPAPADLAVPFLTHPALADPLAQWYLAQALPRFKSLGPEGVQALRTFAQQPRADHLQASLLPALRLHLPAEADAQRARLLTCADPVARAGAISELAEAPQDLESLLQRLWSEAEYDGVQALLPLLEKWKGVDRTAVLKRFLTHPCWTARLDAWRLLQAQDPSLPWPTIPQEGPQDRQRLQEAQALLKAARPVRLRVTFSGNRSVVLRLDPVQAPMNVANLVHLARQGWFNGRRVPRVVPDFVVQMGSPLDTMDGGPGYTVRCENSRTPYGPGTVGMALSGKDTGGSQCFITTNATPHLTARYTRVGEVEQPERSLALLDDLELGARIEQVDVLR